MVNSYVCFDLETTGLSPEKDEIIEIGAVKVVEGKVIDRFSRFVKPDNLISPLVTSLTGISNDMVADAGPTDRTIYDFLYFCEEYPVVGHNLMFDYRFTYRYAKKYYMDFKKEGLDTLKIARKVLPELPSRSLESLCDHYGIVNVSAHRAITTRWRRQSCTNIKVLFRRLRGKAVQCGAVGVEAKESSVGDKSAKGILEGIGKIS